MVRCYVCLQQGRVREGVGLCPHCLIALCAEHLLEEARTPGPGGMGLACHHRIVAVDQEAVEERHAAAHR